MVDILANKKPPGKFEVRLETVMAPGGYGVDGQRPKAVERLAAEVRSGRPREPGRGRGS